MGLQYENRLGDTYHLQEGKTPAGKPRYYMGRKLSGTPLGVLPEGYEIYEAPERGQVFVRKIQPSAITSLERTMTADAIRRLSGLEHVIVDIEANSLVIYVSSMSITEADDTVVMLAGAVPTSLAPRHRERLIKRSTYTKMLRFVLVNPDRRGFTVQRWCFRGSIDNWIFLDGPALLEDLVKKYAKHLGKESFFDLM
jgi:hypothetical protein